VRVADIGAGTGFFTKQLAMAVGQQGRVYAVEIEPTLIAHIDGREDLDLYRDRVVTILGEPDDPGLPAGELDVVMLVNTWHHISGRTDYMKRLQQSLNGDGRVVIIDWNAGDLPMGPPPEQRLPRQTVVDEFEQAGWTFDTESAMLPYQYFFVFEPPRADGN
jgi:SAM-dependent methyltransferase